METISATELPATVRKAFKYRKHKAFRTITGSVTIPSQAGTWTGGTRDLYSLVNLASGSVKSLTNTMAAPWGKERQNRVVEIPAGYAVVKTGMFCGKTATLHIYMRE